MSKHALSKSLTPGHPAASGEVRIELGQLGQEPVPLRNTSPDLQTGGTITEDHRDLGNQKSGLPRYQEIRVASE